MLRRFIQDENGAIAMEYGLIAALVAVASIGAVFGMSAALQATFIAWSAGM